MEFCFKCQRSDKSVRLLDAIYGNEIVKICDECSSLEGIPVIRKPNSFQLQESEKPYTVRERLSRMAGIPLKKEVRVEEVRPKLTLDNLRKPKDYSRIIEDRQRRIMRNIQPLNLIDNYNWHIQMERRKKKLSLNQVAEVIGESPSALRFIEDGDLPDDANRIIGKLEQYFRINLRKASQESESKEDHAPARILNFDEKAMGSLKISDLKRIKEQREKEAGMLDDSQSGELVGRDIEFEE